MMHSTQAGPWLFSPDAELLRLSPCAVLRLLLAAPAFGGESCCGKRGRSVPLLRMWNGVTAPAAEGARSEVAWFLHGMPSRTP